MISFDKNIDEKFFKYFDIQEDTSECAYFTGTMQPKIDDDMLFKLILLYMNINTKEDLKHTILNDLIEKSKEVEDIKLRVQKLFNPWLF